MIVVDRSALVAFLTDSGQRARSRMAQETPLHAPRPPDPEITAALLGMPRGTADVRIKKGLTKPNGGSITRCEILWDTPRQ